MLLNRKIKVLIYILLFILGMTFIIPFSTYALDTDSIYVWSNNTSSISTSNTPTEKLDSKTEDNQDNSRQFLRNNIR